MKKLIQVVVFTALLCALALDARASAAEIYLAQTGMGSANGSSCVNPRPVSYFSSPGSWGAGITQIGPGTVVRLCGTITGNMNTQGSGAAGNHVVIQSEPGATLLGDPIIQHNYSTWRLNMLSDGIFIGGAGMPHHVTIENGFLQNDCDGTPGDIIRSEGSTDVLIQGNIIRNCATNGNNHDDGVQTWASGGQASRTPRNWTIRYNWFIMDSPAENNKSYMMIENMDGAFDLYGNVFEGRRGAGSGNGVNMNNNRAGMIANISNNTQVQFQGGPNNLYNLDSGGTYNMRNNITSVFEVGNSLTGSASPTRQNNLWNGPGSPSCNSSEICNQNPQFVNQAANNFALQASSPALTTGLNLGAAYATGPAAGATWPNPTIVARPATGAWSMGAIVNGGTPPPSPNPTLNLTANPLSVISGQSSVLTWSTTNSTGCVASGAWTGPRPISGTQSVSPVASSTYDLTCAGAPGTTPATRSVTVSVSVTPPPTYTYTTTYVVPAQTIQPPPVIVPQKIIDCVTTGTLDSQSTTTCAERQ